MVVIEAPIVADGARRSIPSGQWWSGSAKPTLWVASAVDRVRRAPTILEAMRTLPALLAAVEGAVAQGVPAGDVLEPLAEAIGDAQDTVTALAAIHAVALVPGREVDETLLALMLEGAPGYEEHASWAVDRRSFAPELARAAARAVGDGAVPGMHAQLALARWARTHPAEVLVALESTLREREADSARRQLVETIGLVPGGHASLTLQRVALDGNEAEGVRRTAVSAFADRLAERLPSSLDGLVRRGGELGAAVRRVRGQRRLLRRGARRDPERSGGLRVAQVHLGEAGGLATLLPQLGDALVSRSRIAETVTFSRASSVDPQRGATRRGRHRLERLALAPGEGATFGHGWPALVEIARGLRAGLSASHVPDILHLRMADPGSLAGASVARELGIPIVFTLAPDPHGPIAAGEGSGRLDRRTFASTDAREALWFRTCVVAQLARQAKEVVLFPRADVGNRIRTLTGIDLASGPPRSTIVPEGIDTTRADRAARTITRAKTAPPVLVDLRAAIGHLPRERLGLPLLVSVGRLHEVKGMSRLVEAFGCDSALGARANLVIVGGDLQQPSATEAAELSRIARAFARHAELRERVILLGNRSNDEVALLLAAARSGWGAVIGEGGAYACASAKEEFGLAIVEALAAGLPVVAPQVGGPATYIEEGVTGMLVDTTDPVALARGAREALDLAGRAQTAPRTRALVDARFTLERMARNLAAVYRVAAGASTLSHDVATGAGA